MIGTCSEKQSAFPYYPRDICSHNSLKCNKIDQTSATVPLLPPICLFREKETSEVEFPLRVRFRSESLSRFRHDSSSLPSLQLPAFFHQFSHAFIHHEHEVGLSTLEYFLF